MQPDDHTVKLTIEDDGELRPDMVSRKSLPRPADRLRGQAQNQSKGQSKGMGLRNMRERMDAFQGTLNIRNSRRGGLVVEARVPINADWLAVQNNNPVRENHHAA